MSWFRKLSERLGLRSAERPAIAPTSAEPEASTEARPPMAKVIPLNAELVREIDADMKEALRKVREES